MKYIVDRLEEDLAICETDSKKTVSLPLSQLPAGIREGDILLEESGRFFSDPEQTKARRSQMKKKLMDLFE